MTIDPSNPSSGIGGVLPPVWGSDIGLSKEEASFQAAMNLGALATQLDRLLKAGGNDPAATAEIKRLIGILQSYGDNIDPKVKGWMDSLLAKLTDSSGNLSLTTTSMQAYLSSYRIESSPGKHDDIASQILAWAFPSSGNWPYKPDVNANADTKFAAIRFMTSLYGSNASDLDSNMEGFFSQGGAFGSFAEEAGIFVSLYLELNADKNLDPKAFRDDIINSFKDKDPTHVDPSFQKFLESVEKEYYTDYVKNTLGLSLEDAMNAIGALLSSGFGGGTGVYTNNPGTTPGESTGISTVTLPAPTLPPSGSPDGSLPGKQAVWGSGSDLAYDKLLQFAQYFGYVKTNDPTAMFNFANYVIGLSESGILANDPKIQQMLESMGAMSMLQTALHQAMEYAFFTSDPPSEAGEKLKAYIVELKNTLGNVQPPNAYITQMIKTVEAFGIEADTFIADHTDANGNLIWTDSQTGKVYNWTDPKNPGTLGDRFMIQMEIAAEGVPATKQLLTALNGLLRDYRVNTLEELLKEFSDPMFAIVLWLMSYNDKNVQAQQSGENDQEDVMSKIITDHYANGLQGLAASAGQWTADDVDKLQYLLQDGDAFMRLAPEASGLAANWQSNVSGPIENMQMVNLDGTPMVDKDGNPVTLKTYLETTPDSDRKVLTLNHMFDTTPPAVNPGGDPPTYQANTNYQVFTQATTTGTQLANGQSKNITTALGTLSTLASAILKTMNGIVDNTGVGGMMNQFVKNQRS